MRRYSLSMASRLEMGSTLRLEHAVGVDLGQAQDPTAIVAIETEVKTDWHKEVVGGRWGEPIGVEREPLHRVIHLERLPLQLPYPGQAARVATVMGHARLEKAALLVDQTGVGAAVVEIFRQLGLRPIGVVITGGTVADAVRSGVDRWNVPKLALISAMQAKLHGGRLKFPSALPEARVLATELSEFRMRFSEAGNLNFGARSGRHDDLVLALGLALWWASQRSKRMQRVPVIGF
jgi:hypothetical protein